jgi:hypothetical protein
VRSLTTFATPDFPLHPSGARQLLVCPWRIALHHMFHDGGDHESGAPADTGSAMHAAAAAFHRGATIADAVQTMGEGTRNYPQADLQEAAAMFFHYAQDPRNTQWKSFPCIERLIQFSIAPHETDPTGAPIAVEMTVDQVVEDEFGRLFVRDIKTTKKEPAKMAAHYTYQVALYCIGVAGFLNRRVEGAKLVFPRKYGKGRPADAPAHWNYAWGWDDLSHIIEPIRFAVANIRRGYVHELPNEDCGWCHQRSSDVCRPALREFRAGNPPLVSIGTAKVSVEPVVDESALAEQMARLSVGIRIPGV